MILLKRLFRGLSVAITEIASKSVLIKRARVDPLFLAGYGMNLYRGCAHACVYCDGQAESYRVEGIFGQDVGVKTNALQLLRQELNPRHHRKPFDKGFVLLGGGVGDSYQPIEKQYQITRGTLELLAEFKLPVHLLTKSTMVLRDIDLLKKIDAQSRAIVSFSFSSVDEHLSALIEPGVPSPLARLDAIRQLKGEGLTCGMFLMPVVPYLSDSNSHMTEDLKQAKSAGVDFAVFGGMTLKDGKQKEHFTQILKKYFPQLVESYSRLYSGDRWGSANENYYLDLYHRFYGVAKIADIPIRMPISLCNDYVNLNDLTALYLEQMDYFLKMEGRRSSLGYVAYQLSKIKTDLRFADFGSIKGMTPDVERTVREILQTGDCRQYQDQISFKVDKNGS
jgi:DNA repair photolyase